MSKSSHFTEEEQEEERHKAKNVLSFLKAHDYAPPHGPFVDLLIKMRFKPKGWRKYQPQMKDDLKRAYGARKIPDGDFQVWSPVVEGGWIPLKMTKAAHIVPLSVGQESMNYIFGKDAKGEINSARNGLWLPTLFEEKFDNFQVVIVPAGEPRQWKVLVLDSGIRNGVVYANKTFKELNGTKLVFQNDAQPRARYFYFHYLCAMLNRSEKMREMGISMNNNAASDMPELSRAWGSEGSYMRENVILGFVERLGDSVGPEGAEMIRSHSREGVAPNELKRVGSAISNLDLDSEDEDEDEDDDD